MRFKISGIDIIKSTFEQNRILTRKELEDYINHNIQANNFINQKQIKVKFSNKTNSKTSARYYHNRKMTFFNNLLLQETINKDNFRKHRNFKQFIKKNNLNEDDINGINIKLLQVANHELFH